MPFTHLKLWTEPEMQFLRDNYQDMLIPDMAKQIGRSRRSVEHKLKNMGLRLTTEQKRRRCKPPKPGRGEANPNWRGGISKNYYHYKRIQMQRYPERVKARAMVHNALKSGRMQRCPCEVCGNMQSEAHHDDYSKPLDVRWLCTVHHDQLHAKEPR